MGKDAEGKDQVYIGEAEEVYKRLTQHLNQKDFWNEVIVFISKDENLNKAHIKYLESRMYDIANTIKRYKLDNSSFPTQSSISESDRAEMEEFLDNVKLLVNTLGHKVFEEKREFQSRSQQNIFFISAPRGANAQGQPTSEGFVVFKGSKIANDIVPSFSPQMQNLRERLQASGIIKVTDGIWEITEDYIFGSPSTAAAIVMGRSANGLTEWKMPNGRTLKGFESEEDVMQSDSVLN